MSMPTWLVHSLQIFLAMLVGVATACQPSVNAKFAAHMPSRLYGGLMNFAVGLLAMIVVLLLVRPPAASMSHMSQAPWWSWTGGLLGAFFVTMAIFLVPKMGAAVFVAAVVASQLTTAAVIDHFGLLDQAVKSLTWGRCLGVALMFAGVACIRVL